MSNINNQVADFKRQLHKVSKNNLIRMYIGAFAKITMQQVEIDKLKAERVELNKKLDGEVQPIAEQEPAQTQGSENV